MKEKQKGAITVEASLVLTIFMMGYMCMLSLVQIVKAQSIMQYVVDEVALDLSRNTYLLTKAGVTEKLYGTSQKGKKFEGDTVDVVNNVTTVFSSVGNMKSSSNISEAYSNYQKAASDYNNAKSSVDSYVDTYMSSADELWSAITTWGKMKAEGFVENTVVKTLVKSRVKRQVDLMSNKGANEYLQKLGIKDGLNGLKFEGTEWMQANSEGRPGVRIEMSYEMQFNWYYFVIKDLKYKVVAYTATW